MQDQTSGLSNFQHHMRCLFCCTHALCSYIKLVDDKWFSMLSMLHLMSFSLFCDSGKRVQPGESSLAFYTAENRSSTPITGISIYSVTPMKVYVYKIICRCSFPTSAFQTLRQLMRTPSPLHLLLYLFSMFSSLEHLKILILLIHSDSISIRQVWCKERIVSFRSIELQFYMFESQLSFMLAPILLFKSVADRVVSTIHHK